MNNVSVLVARVVGSSHSCKAVVPIIHEVAFLAMNKGGTMEVFFIPT